MAALERATGTTVHIIRNYTPEIQNFNGITFQDGHIFVSETAQHPILTVAGHEFTHNLKKTHPELYQRLEEEVRRQGKIPEYQAELSKRLNGEKATEALAVEELTQTRWVTQ